MLTLDAGLMPQGTARTLSREGLYNHGLVWTRDGKAIVYSAGVRLWRVRADGNGAPERMELAEFAIVPTAATGRDRQAFVRMTGDVDLYEVEPGVAPRPLAQSTLLERQPSYSRDGRRIAFQANESTRGSDIWFFDTVALTPPGPSWVPASSAAGLVGRWWKVASTAGGDRYYWYEFTDKGFYSYETPFQERQTGTFRVQDNRITLTTTTGHATSRSFAFECVGSKLRLEFRDEKRAWSARALVGLTNRRGQALGDARPTSSRD